jgi:hypothetical protein
MKSNLLLKISYCNIYSRIFKPLIQSVPLDVSTNKGSKSPFLFIVHWLGSLSLINDQSVRSLLLIALDHA